MQSLSRDALRASIDCLAAGGDARRLLILALLHIDGLGPVRINTLLHALDTLAGPDPAAHLSLAGHSGGQAGRVGRLLCAPRRSAEWTCAERNLEWLSRHRAEALLREDEAFPALLRELPDCPPILFIKGQREALNKSCISVVGTRKPTSYGRALGRRLGAELAAAGQLVASGMALGIDTAAHEGALQHGATAAVWATGLDRVYPARNHRLASQIAERGVIVSEMPLGTAPLPGHFPRRNRLVSGLARGVVVVEASLPSGSLLTANFAAEQSREVFAVPGLVDSPTSRGCHQLIREGATLVERAEDILETLGVAPGSPCHQAPGHRPPQLPTALQTVFGQLTSQPVAAEALALQYGHRAESLASALVELELLGLACCEGGLWSRAGPID